MHTPTITMQAPPARTARLWGFLSLSMLLHTLLLTGISRVSTDTALADYGNPTVNVVIRNAPRPDIAAEPPPASRISPPSPGPTSDTDKPQPTGLTPRPVTTDSRSKTRTPAPAPARETTRPVPAGPQPVPAPLPRATDGQEPAPIRHAEAPPRPASDQPAERAPVVPAKRNFILGRIEHLLGRYLVYPRLAVRRGWEGEVILSFRLLADGRIEDIAVSRSSGHAILDRAAEQGLQRLNRIEGAVDWLQGRSLDLEIPVHYRLRG